MTEMPSNIAQAHSTLAQAQQHLPRGEDFLMWPPCLQSYGYRIVDKLFATRVVRRGERARELPRGQALAASYVHDGAERSVDMFMDRNNVAGLLVIKDGEVVTGALRLGLAAARPLEHHVHGEVGHRHPGRGCDARRRA